MNEHFFSIRFDNGNERYGYAEHGLLSDVIDFARGMTDMGFSAEVVLNDHVIVTWVGNGPIEIVDSLRYFDLTHWECNASWLYGSEYGEFRCLGFYDSERDAIDHIERLAHDYTEHISWDARMLGADAITLDVRPAGPNCFEYSIDVYANGKVA